MAKIHPGEGLARQRAVARVLLSIVGSERAHEVQTRSAPLHFEVPEDVAVEYERRLRKAAEVRAAKVGEPAAEEPAAEESTEDGQDEPVAEEPVAEEPQPEPAPSRQPAPVRRPTRSTK